MNNNKLSPQENELMQRIKDEVAKEFGYGDWDILTCTEDGPINFGDWDEATTLVSVRFQERRAQEREWIPTKHGNLLTCPFCGSAPEWVNETLPDSHYHIKCFTCRIVMKADRRDKVIGMWNKRASTTTA